LRRITLDDPTPLNGDRVYIENQLLSSDQIDAGRYKFSHPRAHRDSVNKKVMAYFSKKYGQDMSQAMPFNMNRFAFGGFKVMVTS
jgi:uncharacterized protein YbaA (DUF1428 family)